MTYDANTKPNQAEPASQPEHLEINSKASQEGTSPEPDLEAVATELGEEKMKPEPQYEKIRPTMDLNEIFDFEGGYGKPPRHHKFRKGTSGNPGGRPPGSKNKPKPLTDENLSEILQSEYYKPVRVNGGPTVSAARAITRRLVDLAVAGDVRAIKLALTSLQAADAAVARQQEAEYNYWTAYVTRLKNDPMRILYDSRRPAPDPKQIIFDHVNKRVLYTGPRNEEEMFEYLATTGVQEEARDEVEEQNENGEIAEEGPEELRCPPRSYSSDPDEEERLRRPARDDHDEDRLRTPAPDQREEERLRKPAPEELEDERLRKPATDQREEDRLRKPAPDELEDERLR